MKRTRVTRRCTAVLAAAFLAGGCAVGPEYREPAPDVGSGWAAPGPPLGEADADRSRWWTSFDDPTLERLVEQALTGNRELAQAVAHVAEARALLDAAAGGRYPAADATAGITRRRQSENGPLPIGQIPGLDRDQTIYDLGFDALWEADLFGRTRRSIEAAEARFGEAVEQRRAAELTVAAEVARAYLTLRGLQREREAQDAALTLSRGTAAIVRRRFELGDVPEAAVAQSEAELATLEAGLPLADAEIRQAALAIGVLVGELPEAELGLLETVEDSASLAPLPVGERADLLRRRPDVRAAERRLAAATADIGVATAEWFPRLAISASGGFQALDGSDLLDSASEAFALAPLLSWRFLDGGRIRAQIRVREARAAAAAAAYESAVLAALGDAERAVTRYHYDLAALDEQRRAADAARRSRELAQIRYDAGDIALFELLDAERVLRDAERAYARRHRASAIDLVALYKALGGGWTQ